jgi:hypothetical protein
MARPLHFMARGVAYMDIGQGREHDYMDALRIPEQGDHLYHFKVGTFGRLPE